MRLRIWIVFSVLVTLSCVFGASATTLVRMTLEDLAAHAALVIRARCVGSEAVVENGEIWTRSRFEVLETLKGSAPREVVVRMIGGRSGAVLSTVEGVPKFSANEDVFLFLEPLHGAGGIGLNEWAVTGWSQGSFRVQVSRRSGTQTVWQDTSGISLFEPEKRVFTPGGVREVEINEFRSRVRDAVRRAADGRRKGAGQ